MHVLSRNSMFASLLGTLLAVSSTATELDSDPGPVRLVGESEAKGRRVAALEKIVADGQLAEAVGEYVRLLDDAGDEMVPIDGKRCLNLRRRCHLGLLALPASAIERYRERIDGRVKKWWVQAEASNDRSLLRRIVDEAFCSSYAGRALDLLGDLAFEHGDLEDAEHWWQTIAPLHVGSSPGAMPAPKLMLRDPGVDVARVRAKQILVQLMCGEPSQSDEAIRSFQSMHPEAAGQLAGVQGRYIDTLRSLALHRDQLVSPIAQPPWTTFGGRPSRTFVPPRAAHISFAHPIWTVAIPDLSPRQGGENRAPVQAVSVAAQVLPFHPAIAGGQVLLSDGYRVIGYDGRSGRETGRYQLFDDVKDSEFERMPPRGESVAFTLSAEDDRIYARLGAMAMQAPDAKQSDCAETVVACLDLAPLEGRFQPVWQVRARDLVSEAAMFEGSPAVKDGRVTVAVALFSGVKLTSAIACFDAQTGARLWFQRVCEAPELKIGEPRYRHYLLTTAGANIVYCTHSGAIIALDAATGGHVWGVRYRSRGALIAARVPPPRDVAPCIWWRGRVFAAPLDYDRIMCVDADSGELLWESQEIEVTHLLGVSDGRLVFTTGSWPAGTRAVDCANGRLMRSCFQPDDGQSDSPSLGRGLLTQRAFFWPSRFGLRVLDSMDGRPDAAEDYYTRSCVRGGGNLALGEGLLAVADATQVRVYVDPPPLPGPVAPPRAAETAVRGAGPVVDHRARPARQSRP